jgi:hypothetical protein
MLAKRFCLHGFLLFTACMLWNATSSSRSSRLWKIGFPQQAWRVYDCHGRMISLSLLVNDVLNANPRSMRSAWKAQGWLEISRYGLV